MVTLSPGSTFHGRYEVVRCIKAGGMGAIYEVIHLETKRRRALKVMLPGVLGSVDMRARFKLEATVAADIESEHIVETFDAGVDERTGAPFLVMELLRGEDVAALVERRGRLSPQEVVDLLAQTASALDKTHAAGVIHRDLKPDNLFVTRRDDGAPKIKILDFGIAKVMSESGEPAAKTRVLGTPIYMSPEQVRGDGRIGPRADLYALGQIAFTLLTGKAYWAEEHAALSSYALMTKIVGGCLEPASARAARHGGASTPAFDPWFARATHVLPEERFGSAAATIEALAEALGVDAPRMRSVEPLAPPARSAVEGDGATLSLEAHGDDTEVSSQPAFPTTTVATETGAPASLAVVESPRRSPVGKRVAGVAMAALVLAAVVLASRPAAQPRPAALPAASESAETSAPKPPAPSEPPVAPTTVATTAPPAAPSARATARVASPRRPPPQAPAPTPSTESDTRPKRSLD